MPFQRKFVGWPKPTPNTGSCRVFPSMWRQIARRQLTLAPEASLPPNVLSKSAASGSGAPGDGACFLVRAGVGCLGLTRGGGGWLAEGFGCFSGGGGGFFAGGAVGFFAGVGGCAGLAGLVGVSTCGGSFPPRANSIASNRTRLAPCCTISASCSVVERAVKVTSKGCQRRFGAVAQYRDPQPTPFGFPTSPRVTTGLSGLTAKRTVYVRRGSRPVSATLSCSFRTSDRET